MNENTIKLTPTEGQVFKGSGIYPNQLNYILKYSEETDAATVLTFYAVNECILQQDTCVELRKAIITRFSDRYGMSDLVSSKEEILIEAQKVLAKVQLQIEKREQEKRTLLSMMDKINPLFTNY